MGVCLFMAVLSVIVSVTLLYNAEKTDEYVEKFWCLIIGFVFAWVSIFLFKKGLTGDFPTYNPNIRKTEYYNYNDY